jgi:DNA end-binding protein Ku
MAFSSFSSCPARSRSIRRRPLRNGQAVNRRTGHRLKHQLVDSITGEAVKSHDKARGYEVGEDQFLLVEDRELDQARSECLD